MTITMITDIITIKNEAIRITNKPKAYLPVSQDQFGRSFPFGPDGLIVVTGKSGDELVRGVKEAIREIEELPLEEVYSYTDSAFLRMDELHAIERLLSSLRVLNYRNGLSLSGLEGDEGRVSIFFRRRVHEIPERGPFRKEGDFLSIIWSDQEKTALAAYEENKDE